ncbi:MarR family winged helix-turn-helix transcriptional regulator [Arthrobacter silvisoli]|uniref:MarR family winged helix-turn-helix transcriptional regulator n=1 Tax=Arthrobacter silvisoli TaxID=2291022 RepID=UPI000E219E09|nr:helix-turn-helix domain-containing protein [Arthrobacter silvisoli]
MPRNRDGKAGIPPSAAPAEQPSPAESSPAESSPAESSPAQELVRLLREFTLEANRYADTAGGKHGMHRTDLNALAVIMRHSAADRVVTPGVLRSELHLSSPATTALVDRLCASGHVVRERLGTDRRQVQLRMTPKAYRDGSAMFMPLASAMGQAMAPYSAADLELVHRFMSDMLAATAAAGQEPGPPEPSRQDPGGPRTPPGRAG